MTTATAPAPNVLASIVHSVTPGFADGVTFYEGPSPEGADGDWSACGPYAEGACLATVKKVAFTGALENEIIARMTAAQRFQNPGGCTIEELLADIEANEPTVKADLVAGYGLSVDAYHEALKNVMLRGNVAVIYLENAQGLPNNEQGVHGHFVALGGIDSAEGYYVLNGDRVPDNQPNAAYWVDWDGIANAGIGAVLEVVVPWYSGPSGPAPQPPTPAPEPPAPAPADPYSHLATGWWLDTRTHEQIGDGLHTYAVAHALGECTLGETSMIVRSPTDGGIGSYAVFADATVSGASHVVEWRPDVDPHAVENEAGLIIGMLHETLTSALVDQARYEKLHAAVAALASY